MVNSSVAVNLTFNSSLLVSVILYFIEIFILSISLVYLLIFTSDIEGFVWLVTISSNSSFSCLAGFFLKL